MTGVDYLLLSLVWIGWCALHSFMIARFILEACENRLHNLCKYHRLFYNIVSVITFAAAGLYTRSLPETVIFGFSGAWDLVRVIVFIGAVLLFVGGVLSYDMLQFSGLRQILSNTTHRVLTSTGEFKTDGLLRITRHPWYLAGICLIWSSSKTISDIDLIAKVIFTLYFFIGTILEERKLIWQFGDQYLNYQKEVSMLFPFKWVFRSMRGKM